MKLHVKLDKIIFSTVQRELSARMSILMILLEEGKNEKCPGFGVLKVTKTGLFVQQYFPPCPLSQKMTSLCAHFEEADGELGPVPLCKWTPLRKKISGSLPFKNKYKITIVHIIINNDHFQNTLQLQTAMKPSSN